MLPAVVLLVVQRLSGTVSKMHINGQYTRLNAKDSENG